MTRNTAGMDPRIIAEMGNNHGQHQHADMIVNINEEKRPLHGTGYELVSSEVISSYSKTNQELLLRQE